MHDGPVRVEGLAKGGIDQPRARDHLGLGGRVELERRIPAIRQRRIHGTAADGEQVSNDDWWQRQSSGSFGWQPSPTGFVRLNARRLESERGAPGPYGSDPIGVFPGVDTIARGNEDDRQMASPHSTAGGRCSPAACGSDTRFPTIISRTTSSAASARLTF